MLEDLLSGQEKSCFVLITDEADCSGRYLLMSWIRSLGTRCDKIIFLCLERPPEFFKACLPAEIQEKLLCICGHGKDSHDIFDAAASALSQVRGEAGIIVDSLTLQIMLQSAPVICCALHKLISAGQMVQLVAILHRDCHDRHTCSLVEHVATSVVDVKPASGMQRICHIRHCRTTGKVFKVKERFRLDENFHIRDIGPAPSEDVISPSQSVTQAQDNPAAELPFNLSLTDTEKEARSKVRLPYIKDGSGDSDSGPPSSTGRIIYQLDDADDFDEEDPDDDLSI